MRTEILDNKKAESRKVEGRIGLETDSRLKMPKVVMFFSKVVMTKLKVVMTKLKVVMSKLKVVMVGLKVVTFRKSSFKSSENPYLYNSITV